MVLHTYMFYSHRADLDGISSAAILKRYADSIGEEYSSKFADYRPKWLVLGMLREISEAPSGSTIVIADFSADRSIADETVAALKKAYENGSRIIWVDHHKWGDLYKRIAPYAEVILKEDGPCAAELVYERFMKNDEQSKYLAALGRDSDWDMWQYKPSQSSYVLTRPLTKLISYYNYLAGDDTVKYSASLNRLVETLSRMSVNELRDGDSWKERLGRACNEDLEIYEKLEKLGISELLAKAKTVEINGYKVAISMSNNFLSSSIAGDALKSNTGADLALVVNDGGRVSFRRGENKLKCDDIASAFSGGGHEYAAAGNLPKEFCGEKNYAEAVRYIEEKLSRILPQKQASASKNPS